MKNHIVKTIFNILGLILFSINLYSQSLFNVVDTTGLLNEEQKDFLYRVANDAVSLENTFVSLGNISEIQNDGVLVFNSPNGDSIEAVAYRVNYQDENTYSWTGKFDDGFITLVRASNGTGGMLKTSDHFYFLHPVTNDISVFVKTNPEIYSNEICGVEGGSHETGSLLDDECISDCYGEIADVLIVWTPEALSWLNTNLGSPFNIALYGTLAMESVNIAFENSEISGEVNYTGVLYNDFTTNEFNLGGDLQRLSTEQNIENLRNEHCADLVVLITNAGYMIPTNTPPFFSSISGIAQTFTGDKENAFAIVEVRSLIFPRWTFAHELAHLLGALHNRPSNGGDNDEDVCTHAWAFDDSQGDRKSTIVAFSGERVLHYSNPDISFNGGVTGTMDDNNAGGMQKNICTVADFIPGKFSGQIVGWKYPCRCLPFPPQTGTYIEDWEYSAEVNTPVNSSLPGQPPYTYAWYWNETGIFTSSNPGNFIDNTETITIDFDYPCNQFFLRLVITSSDGLQAIDTKRLFTGQCIGCNQNPCFAGGGSDDRSGGKVIEDSQKMVPVFSISPNPAKDIVSFTFSHAERKNIELQIVNIAGKVIYQSLLDHTDLNNNQYDFSLKKLPQGVYWCICRIGKNIDVQKLIVIE